MNEEESRIWDTHFPLRTLFKVKAIVEKLRKLDWSKELPPILTIYDPKDLTVNPDQIVKYHKLFRSVDKQIVRFDTAQNHILFNPATEEGRVSEQKIFDLATPFMTQSLEWTCRKLFTRAPKRQ